MIIGNGLNLYNSTFQRNQNNVLNKYLKLEFDVVISH